MLSRRHRLVLLLAVLVAGAALRCGPAGYGLPRHDLGQDEMITALRVRDGALVGHPGWPAFHWPNLNIYLSRGVVAGVRWLEGALGLAGHDDVLIGRLYTATLGTLTLVLLYLVGARLFDPLVALAAAGFLAVIPLHVFRSRLWVPDVPMTLFYTLALLAAAVVVKRPAGRWFVLGGVAVGLATATKYNGVGACLPLAVAAWLGRSAVSGRGETATLAGRLGLAAALSVAVFFAVDWLALPRFDRLLEGVGFVAGQYVDAPASGLFGWHIWLYIAGSFFAPRYEGVGPVICVLALVGWALLVARRDRAGTLAWLPGLLFLVVFSSILHDPFERMFLPLTPHLALLAAVALVAAARRVAAWAGGPRPSPAIAGGVVLAGLLVAAVPATEHAVAAGRGETRLQAATWLDAKVPAGAFVMREWDMVWPSKRHFDFNRRLHDLWEGDWTPRLVARHMDFVVTTSTNFERVRRQRHRPVFARRAGFYDEMFHGPLFELAARFEPGLDAFGPEVRIYRGLGSRGRTLGPARSELDLMRQNPWVSTPRLRQERPLAEGYRFRAAGDLVAGSFGVRPGGWYLLEVAADSSGPAPLELGLGRRRATHRVAERATVVLRTLLPPGKNWWRVGAGPGFGDGDTVTVRSVRLVRPDRPAAGGAAARRGEASAPPAGPNNDAGGL